MTRDWDGIFERAKSGDRAARDAPVIEAFYEAESVIAGMEAETATYRTRGAIEHLRSAREQNKIDTDTFRKLAHARYVRDIIAHRSAHESGYAGIDTDEVLWVLQWMEFSTSRVDDMPEKVGE